MGSENRDIYTYCIDLLSRRGYSTFKLIRKLKQRKYPAIEIDVVIKLLTLEKYLRDDLYAEARVRNWISKNNSAFQIKRKLQMEMLSLTGVRIEELFGESDQSEQSQVQKLIEAQMRKIRKMPTDRTAIYKLKQKITSAVMRKGHAFGLIKSELDRVFISS